MLTNMRVVVTGGCGFIGTNFILHLLKKYPSYKILNIDSLTYSGNKENLKDVENDPRYSFINEDICNPKIASFIEEGDIIVNFAAESHVDNSIKEPSIFIKTNILGTHNLLEIARNKKAKLFVQISTDEVYGSLNLHDPSSKEEDSLNPRSPYSSSKAAAEMICMGNFHTFGQPIIITRSSNNFGAYQFPEKIIPLFITNLLEGEKVPLYGQGTNIRDWLFVKDNCEAIDLVLHQGEPGQIYNIGGGTEIKNIELTGKILEILGKDNSSIAFVKDRQGHDLRYSLNCSKIESLGWSPKFNFDEALKETVFWYKNNVSWWKPLKKIKWRTSANV